MGGTFCELEKAFHCVNHGIVVDKPEFYGISGKFLWYKLISQLGTKKYSLVQLMRMIIFLLDVKSYTLGSSGFDMGFVILLIYFNDLHKIRDNDAKVVLFANDTSIAVTTSFQEGVQTI